MSKELHIVSFDCPYPPYYGGVIDVFYKIKTLNELGVKVHLHYFADEAQDHQALKNICETITHYPKSSVFSQQLFTNIPFRMLVRRNSELTKNLAENDFPILYEGLHSSYSALNSNLKKQSKFLRCHNAEAEYAKQLSRSEDNYLKKVLFQVEANKTSVFERKLIQFDGLFALSDEDKNYFDKSNSNVKIIPIFHAHDKVAIKEGLGDYILFHGNLSVAENIETAMWMAKELAKQLKEIQFVIAGKSSDIKIKNQLEQSNVQCILNPDQEEMQNLIQNAQIVLLKTSVPSGIKLKLIDSLAYARHIVSDVNSVQKSGLSPLVTIANSNSDFKHKIKSLMEKEILLDDITKRNIVFSQALNNQLNALKIIQEIF